MNGISRYLSGSLLQKLDTWRARRRAETGKVVQRDTAVGLLLESALAGVDISRPTPTYEELIARVEALEAQVQALVEAK